MAKFNLSPLQLVALAKDKESRILRLADGAVYEPNSAPATKVNVTRPDGTKVAVTHNHYYSES